MVSSEVNWVCKGAAEVAQLNPLDPPLSEMIDHFMASGGKIVVYSPCAQVCGYASKDLIDGVSIAGFGEVHELKTLAAWKHLMGFMPTLIAKYLTKNQLLR